VGVDEIVCSAGVTKPSLYRSFESKGALVAACLQAFAAEALAELDARIEAAGPEPIARLRAIVAHVAGELEEPGFRGCLLSNAAAEFRDESHPGRAIIDDCKAQLRARLQGIILEAKADSAALLTDGLILLIEGAYSAHVVFGRKGPVKAFVSTAELLIVSHLRP